MDPMGIAGMLFVLILCAMGGGFVLLFPISRRLGAYLEQRLRSGEPARPDTGGAQQLADLREMMLGLQAQLDRVAERQEFTERLLAERSDPALLGSSDAPR